MIRVIKNKFLDTKKNLKLSFTLSKYNFKLRNEGSFLGILWYLLLPLLTYSIILLIRNVAFSNTSIEHYPAYLLVGLVIYNFFIQTVNSNVNLIPENSKIIKSIKTPTEFLVISRSIQFTYSHFFEIILVILLAIYIKTNIIYFLIYPLIFIFLFTFTLGISFLFATIGAYINDFKNIWAIISQLILFVTPIFYAVNPSTKYYYLFLLNPLFNFITITRDMTLYHKIPTFKMFAYAAVSSIVFLIVGYLVFKKYKNRFAEVL